MKKIVVFFSLLILFTGCSNDNKLTVTNYSQGSIHFNFRAQEYPITVGSSIPIKDIPNGTYGYSATFEMPFGAKTFATQGDANSGNVVFEKMNTQVLILYGGIVADSTYTVNANVTSTNSNSPSTTPTHY